MDSRTPDDGWLPGAERWAGRGFAALAGSAVGLMVGGFLLQWGGVPIGTHLIDVGVLLLVSSPIVVLAGLALALRRHAPRVALLALAIIVMYVVGVLIASRG
ncbi:MAG TPA: hypothetical protein VJ992_10350 [Gemmatimonadales bacterium]|nr:hypothetical protein [Gemmatimonadales bacterium]